MQTIIASSHRSGLRKKFAVVALALTTCLGGVAVAVPAADAAPVIRNDVMAVLAASALTDMQTYLVTGDRETRQRFVASRNGLAVAMSMRLGIDPVRMQVAWASADDTHQKALLAALSQLGVRYRRNMSRAGEGFDCSGLTSYAWAVAGVSIAHQSRTQIRAAVAITAATAQAGDLVYYPGHVMMYLGVDSAIVHAPNSGRTVEVGQLTKRKNVRFGDPTH
ncbi:unannotated protein [freshwater metagenome]|uniref:Unannotated protein n=1 Tax=freshwater metagenome TaxID=449393 RepID=A0A6J7DD64_9ZZZZ|nr:hypothetical protein [Actinomycetota bacterium]